MYISPRKVTYTTLSVPFSFFFSSTIAAPREPLITGSFRGPVAAISLAPSARSGRTYMHTRERGSSASQD